MKQTKVNAEVIKKAEEHCEAMNNINLILNCVQAGVLMPAEAKPYVLHIFEVLGIKK